MRQKKFKGAQQGMFRSRVPGIYLRREKSHTNMLGKGEGYGWIVNSNNNIFQVYMEINRF
jgi:hypothetical protein